MTTIKEYLLSKKNKKATNKFPADRSKLKDFIKSTGFTIMYDDLDLDYNTMMAKLNKLAKNGPAAVFGESYVRVLKEHGISRSNPVYMVMVVNNRLVNDSNCVKKEYDLAGEDAEVSLSYKDIIDEINTHFGFA